MTTGHPSDQPSPRIREEDVRKLIARAIELDRQNADGLTLDQVRHVAAESGISSEAFETALREAGYQGAPTGQGSHPGESSGRRPETMLRYAIVFGIVLLALVVLLEL